MEFVPCLVNKNSKLIVSLSCAINRLKILGLDWANGGTIETERFILFLYAFFGYLRLK